ncbi:hypothetical protein J437_LFUL011579, partial [Ladona fulva]
MSHQSRIFVHKNKFCCTISSEDCKLGSRVNEVNYEKEDHPLRLSKWNFMLESQLTHRLTSITGVDVLRENYKDSRNIQLAEVDGLKLLNEAIPKMAEVLKRKEEALKRLVDEAENAVSEYKENPALSLEDVKFLNMKELRKNDEQLHYSAQFMQNVSFNESGVHIPLEIYEGWMGPRYKVVWWHDPQILNGLKWSSSLNEVFKENLRLDPSLRWQYFGSQRGFMRVFPALRAIWFHLFQTLRELNKYLDWTVEWSRTFIKFANFFNSYLKLDSHMLQTLAVFEERKQPWEGSDCHKVIMFFSDGGTEWPEEVLLHYRNDSITENVRIFTYACGPHPIPTVILKTIACETKGFGIAVPVGVVYGKVSYNNFRESLNFVHPDGVLLAPWKFCEKAVPLQNLSNFVTESLET